MTQKTIQHTNQRKGKRAGLWISLMLSVLTVVFSGLSQSEISIDNPYVQSLEIIEAKMLDIRFGLRGKLVPDSDIVIVAVDEKTEDELGRWQSCRASMDC